MDKILLNKVNVEKRNGLNHQHFLLYYGKSFYQKDFEQNPI